MNVPSWFKRSLKVIDPTYKVDEPEDKKGYFIVKDLDLTLKADGGSSLSVPNPKFLRVRGPRVVLWVPDLTEQALEALRQMKLKALELKIYEDPMNELAYYQSLHRKAKEKRLDLAVDMISEGFMEAHKLGRKKSWSYGGKGESKKQEA